VVVRGARSNRGGPIHPGKTPPVHVLCHALSPVLCASECHPYETHIHTHINSATVRAIREGFLEAETANLRLREEEKRKWASGSTACAKAQR
jgi:hypothetical protein